MEWQTIDSPEKLHLSIVQKPTEFIKPSSTLFLNLFLNGKDGKKTKKNKNNKEQFIINAITTSHVESSMEFGFVCDVTTEIPNGPTITTDDSQWDDKCLLLLCVGSPLGIVFENKRWNCDNFSCLTITGWRRFNAIAAGGPAQQRRLRSVSSMIMCVLIELRFETIADTLVGYRSTPSAQHNTLGFSK